MWSRHRSSTASRVDGSKLCSASHLPANTRSAIRAAFGSM